MKGGKRKNVGKQSRTGPNLDDQGRDDTPPIPILCFADNCIIVCKTNTKCINFVQYTLNLFAIEAGLSINWEKTKAFFSKNTPPHRSKEICQQLKLGKETLVRNTWVYPLTSIGLLKILFLTLLIKLKLKSPIGTISIFLMQGDAR